MATTKATLDIPAPRPWRIEGQAIWDADGNTAALRAALEEISLLSSIPPPHWKLIAVIEKLGNLADVALAAPARNCDVGTAEEQARRFQLFCQANRAFDAGCSSKCPFVAAADINHCQAGWAQMPYEKGEAREAIGEGEP